MGIEDLNPYGQAGLQSFESRTMQSMDASPDIPRVTDNYSIYGSAQMAGPSLADVAALGAQLSTAPEIKQPSVGINRSTNQMFVNGLMFDVDDYQTADKSASAEYLEREPTGLPSGFEQIAPETYGNYIRSIRDPGKMRLMGKNFGIGVDNLQMLGGAGLSYLGDTFDSETLSGLGRDIIEQQQEDLRRKEPFQRTFTDDVVAEGEVADWFLANLAQQGPNLIESVLAFIGGAVVSTTATANPFVGAIGGFAGALGKQAFKKKLMDAVAKKQAGEVLDKAEKRIIAGTGAVIAGALNNFRTGVSDVYLEMLENAEGEVPGSGQRLAALAAGIPYAAAETFSEYFVASKFFNPASTSGIFKRVAKAFGSGAVAEGATEGLQESLVIGTDAATSEREALTLANGERLINAIAAGAAVGGPISGLSGLRSGQEADILSDAGQQGGPLVPQGGPLVPVEPQTGPTGQAVRMGMDEEIVFPTQIGFTPTELPPYTGSAVATPVEDPDFTVNTEGVADPNPQTFDPMDQPVNIQGGFIPGTEQQPQGALNVTPDVTTLNEVNQTLGTPTNRIEEVPAPPPTDPNQLDLPLDDEPELTPTAPPTPRQLPLFKPQEAPKLPKPKRPLTDDIKQPETEFAPSTTPQLENRRDKKDLPATVKSKGQISGGQKEREIVNPEKRQKQFDTINYTQGMRFNLTPQFVQDRYVEAIKKIKLADNFTNFIAAHHNGGIVLANQGFKFAQAVYPNIIAHELGHASHSLLAGDINDNPAVVAELQAVENLLYPDLRATVIQAIADGKKLDNEFFNYLLSPEELIAEFNVFRLANPEQAAQVAPNLSALLESVEQAPDLVVDRKTFPTNILTGVTKATKFWDGDYTKLNAKMSKAAKLKKGKTADQIQAEKEGGPIAGSPEDIAQQQAEDEMVNNARNSGNVAEYKDIMQEEFQVALREIDNIAMNSYWEGLWNRANSIAAVDKVLDDMDQIRFREEMQDAVPKPEAAPLDAQEQTQDGKRVGEKVQKTPRVRTKKKSLKKEKVEEPSVQAKPKPKSRVAVLKRGKAKVVPEVAEREEQETKTPQPVVRQDPAKTWDANKPSPESPSLKDFKDQSRIKVLSQMTAEEMKNIWTDTSALADLGASHRLDILTDSFRTQANTPVFNEIVGDLMQIAFIDDAKAVSERAGSFLLNNLTNENPKYREIALEYLLEYSEAGLLKYEGKPTWYKFASSMQILPEFINLVRTRRIKGFTKVAMDADAEQARITAAIVANEKELASLGEMSRSAYLDKEKGPRQQAERLALILSNIKDMKKITSRNFRSLNQAERYVQGFKGVKPDLSYTFNGMPLIEYFDSSGKLKLQENPDGTLSLTAGTLKETRTRERKANQKFKNPDANVIDDINLKENRLLATKEVDAILSGYYDDDAGNTDVNRIQYKAYYTEEQLQDVAEKLERSSKKSGGRFLRYDNDKPSNPMNPVQIRAMIKGFLSRLANKPRVILARDPADLQNVDPELFKKAVASQPDFATANASGFSIGNNIVIFTDFIENDMHLRFTLAHETMGHFGLRSIINEKQLKQTLNNIYNTSKHIRDVVDREIDLNGPYTEAQRLEAIEEALANHVAYIDSSVLQRIWQPIKRFLQKIGLMRDDDGAAYWVNQLRRYVRNGEIPGFVSPQQLAANIRELNDSEVGRFSASHATVGPDAMSIGMPGFDPKQLADWMRTGKGKAGNMGSMLGFAAEQLQTLDNIALRSLGLTKLLEVFRRQAATARSIMSELDGYTKEATRADFWGLGTGLNKQEKAAVNEMLAYGNAHFAQNISEADIRNAPDAIVQDPISGDPIANEAAIDWAVENATLTREQIKNGFSYLEGNTVSKTHTFTKVLGKDVSNIVLDSKGNQKFADARQEQMYQAYLGMRKAVNRLSQKVALGKYKAAAKLAEGNIQSIKEINAQITEQDLDIFREINEAFTRIYQSGPVQNDGKYRVNAETLAQAEDFINGVTRALWQEGASSDLKNMKPDDDPFENPKGNSQKAINAIIKFNKTKAGRANPIKLDKILAGLDRMRAYKDQSGGNVFNDKTTMNRIQRPLKDQVFTETQLINANVMAKQTMYESYVPYKRRGSHQLRFAAYAAVQDANGNITRGEPVGNVDENFMSTFPYYMDDDIAMLDDMAGAFNNDLNNQVFDVPVQGGGTQKVVMVALRETASGGTPTDISMNYDEFVNVLNNLGISIDLADRERIIESLSKQHDRARSHLQKNFRAGFDPDMIRSVSEYLETGAAIAAKNEHRTDINQIMSTTSNWKGNYNLLKASYAEVEAARRTGNQEAVNLAYEKFEAFAHMYSESASPQDRGFAYTDRKGNKRTVTGKGKGERYRNYGNKLLAFYAQQTDIAISVEDALSKGPLSALKNLAVAMQLGGSIAAGIINLTSIPLMAAPYMATYNYNLGTGGGYGASATTVELSRAAINLKNIKFADPMWIKETVLKGNNYKSYGLTLDEAQFLHRQTSRGILDAALTNSLAGSARGNFFNSANFTEITKKYMLPFSYTEQMNRRITALATYRLEKRKRMAANPQLKDDDFQQTDDLVDQNAQPDLFALEEKAVEVVNKSQGDYAMYNRPDIARGTWAQYIYMYKQFTVIATQLVRTLPPAGRVYYLTALMAVAGLKGLPFADDLADLIDTLAQLFGIKVPPVELAVGKFVEDVTGSTAAAQFVLRGGLDQIGGGGTYSSRLSLGDLLPGTGIFLEGASTPQELKNIAGPIFSAMAGTVTTTIDLAKAPFKADVGGELLRIGQASPIAGLRNIMDTATYYQSGSVINSRGMTVTRDVGMGVLLTRLLGFYPAPATRSNDAIRMTKRLVDYQKAITASYREQYVRAALLNDRRSMNDIELAVREHNRVHRRGSVFHIDDFRGKVRKAVKSAKEGAGARFLKTTPKSTRDTVTDIVSKVYGVDLN